MAIQNHFDLKQLIVRSSEIEEEYNDQSAKICGSSVNFSRHFDLKRIGVHLVRVPVGMRTSKPHAEKTEDEFVFVIDGEVDLWFNGRIKKMQSGECIGFPAGTGVGHCFINNSQKEVLLFVVGERTKNDNQCHFHLEPELKEELKVFWWADMPLQNLGPHNGWPGSVDKSMIDESIETINSSEALKSAQTSSYPGDTETFGHGVCLSRDFKIGTFAVWLEKLPPGLRSAWPHAHSVEEEFVFVLEGTPTLWLNHEDYKIESFSAVDFKAGSGIAHAVYNKSSKDVFYLCVGECEAPSDKIFYPLHPERNQQMRAKGRLWEDCPKQRFPF